MRKVKVVLNFHGLIVEAVILTDERLARLKDFLEVNPKVEEIGYVDSQKEVR